MTIVCGTDLKEAGRPVADAAAERAFCAGASSGLAFARLASLIACGSNK